jgi:putative transposase
VKLPDSLLTLAHQDGKAYGESFDLVFRREASKSDAVWQVDHPQLDILLLREDGTDARPWLTIVIGFDPPSSLRTSLTLH